MKPRTNHEPRAQRANGLQREGPNWVLVAGSALLSTLSIRLGYKLKQVLDAKPQESSGNDFKGNGKYSGRKKSASNHLHHNAYCFSQDVDGCYNYIPGSEGTADMKQKCHGQIITRPEGSLPLATNSAPEFEKENGVIWASSPDRLELPQKPFHHSNSSDSPCMSESGSDIYSKREVIQKLRQQLKRRDDMILEMQDQISDLQSTLSAQLSHSAHLQSMLDAANSDLLDSVREVQRLRKVIADHCLGQSDSGERPPTVPIWHADGENVHSNGYFDHDRNFVPSEKGRGENNRIEMLRREVGELKEVIEGKEFLLKSYKEQKIELALKVKDLQQKLDSQLPSIL
ncbi:hypothetical protein Leryth_007895 [Lithospermum erythrorhizon]|nr:hypothetical protein Leryth_007895 [Lithospermum erythrorhizon]